MPKPVSSADVVRRFTACAVALGAVASLSGCGAIPQEYRDKAGALVTAGNDMLDELRERHAAEANDKAGVIVVQGTKVALKDTKTSAGRKSTAIVSNAAAGTTGTVQLIANCGDLNPVVKAAVRDQGGNLVLAAIEGKPAEGKKPLVTIQYAGKTNSVTLDPNAFYVDISTWTGDICKEKNGFETQDKPFVPAVNNSTFNYYIQTLANAYLKDPKKPLTATTPAAQGVTPAAALNPDDLKDNAKMERNGAALLASRQVTVGGTSYPVAITTPSTSQVSFNTPLGGRSAIGAELDCTKPERQKFTVTTQNGDQFIAEKVGAKQTNTVKGVDGKTTPSKQIIGFVPPACNGDGTPNFARAAGQYDFAVRAFHPMATGKAAPAPR